MNMKIKQTILAFLFIIGISINGAGLPVMAVEMCGTERLEPGQSCCGGVVTSIIKCEDVCSGLVDDAKVACEKDITKSGLWQLLLTVINVLTGGIAILAVAGIVFGSVKYASAGGNADQVKKAKEMIINVVIGLLAWALLYSFLNYLIPGGVLN